MFFLQMSGFPGSGKSTLARQIAKRTGAVIVDHDIVKSALLESMDSHIDQNVAGKISYHIDWSLLDFHLSQGHSVIFDSPCLYTEIVEKGLQLSQKHQVKYKYVECYLNNLDEINSRLQARERKISQIKQAASEAAFYHWVDNSKKPADTRYLVVDSEQPLEGYIGEVMEYLKSDD